MGKNQISFYTKEAIMIGGCYGLQVHSNTYNSVMYTSVLCEATTTIENRSKTLYNSSTKTKDK